MKLRNKKTGNVFRVEFLSNWQTDDGTEIGFRVCNTNVVYSYNSLAELNEEWEDYEESKNYFYLTAKGNIHNIEDLDDEDDEQRKAIGNYFETKEEAEKAVEKLKAWKRLKDKCCISFSGINRNIKGRPVSVNLDFNNEGKTTFDEAKQNIDDLMLLFGGNDESNK